MMKKATACPEDIQGVPWRRRGPAAARTKVIPDIPDAALRIRAAAGMIGPRGQPLGYLRSHQADRSSRWGNVE